MMEEAIACEYDCADCEHRMTLQICKTEMQSSLRAGRTEQCPKCGQLVGTGIVNCRQCGARFTVEMPHWHVHCNLASGVCPDCGSRYISLCIC
jgi:hypothetical protein